MWQYDEAVEPPTETVQRRAPTLEMVAELAGVSRATVSRVINASPKVTPEVVASVNKAIAALNYVPNRAARSLASRKTQAIALIVPESTARVFADPFFASVVQGVATHLSHTDYTLNLLIASEADPDKTRRYLLGGNVDGALVVSHHSGDHSYTQLGNALPIVFGGRPLQAEATDSYYVDADNIDGARMATAHLIQRGRRRLATIAGPQDMPAGIDRLRGFREALASAGLTEGPVEVGDFSPAGGADAMRRILQTGAKIDGVLAANDQMAAGAYAALTEAGLRVPTDVAMIGFDNDNFGATLSPPLTTVDQSPVGLGEEMARKLVQLISGDPVPHATITPTRLVERTSV